MLAARDPDVAGPWAELPRAGEYLFQADLGVPTRSDFVDASFGVRVSSEES